MLDRALVAWSADLWPPRCMCASGSCSTLQVERVAVVRADEGAAAPVQAGAVARAADELEVVVAQGRHRESVRECVRDVGGVRERAESAELARRKS